MDEIPEALRDKQPIEKKPSPRSLPLIAIAGALAGAVLLGTLSFFAWRLVFNSSKTAPVAVTPSPTAPTPSASPSPSPTNADAVENVLGHLPYEEASASQLKAITPDGRIKMKKAAADSFLQMQADALAQGISLTPLSGFRTVEEQNRLFFKVKQERNQEAKKRAEVSAPPGYSEHHTGYAMDIGDGRSPVTNLNVNFEKTAAFGWLKNNANRYSFEISFPPNNSQGVSYEPWHWRYVGDRDSLETFYKAREIKSKIK
jgi:zinc D-Ala-D-Ala carboxypeptidase